MRRIYLLFLFLSGITHAQQQSTSGTGLGLLNGMTMGGGDRSTFIGYEAGKLVQNKDFGSDNTFVGHNSGRSTTYGSQNSFLGSGAGLLNTVGTANSFFGYFAGFNNTVGSNNFFGGNFAGYRNIDGEANIFMGTQSGFENESGSYNIAIGHGAGYMNLVSANVFIGHGAGNSSVNGWSNTYVGFLSGHNAIGSNNVFIGNKAGLEELGSNKLFIESSESNNPLIWGDFHSDLLKFNGKVGVGGDSNAGFGEFPETAGTVNVSHYNLFVTGGILTEEIRVMLKSDWADYVFEESYKLMPISEVERYVKTHRRLPNVPSAEAVSKEGINLGEMIKLQQEKIEELTLYIIQQEKKIDRLTSMFEKVLNQTEEYEVGE